MARTKQRSGFAALIGRPNVGKSSLLNRLTGEKIAIVSPKPQTTRNRILGVVTRPEGQVAFIDTPGIHNAKGELNRYMVEAAFGALDEVEVNLFLIEPPENPKKIAEIDPQNRSILERLLKANKPTFLVINKIDTLQKNLLLPLMDAYQQAFSFAELVPISARTGENVDLLFERVLATLPEGPPLFDEDMLTDQAERTIVAEYIREQVLFHCRQEIPYSAAVVIEEFDEAEREPNASPSKSGLAGLVRIAAAIVVERDSQKAIVIGKSGSRLKTIGQAAREEISHHLGRKVHLFLHVKVNPRWQEDRSLYREMGLDWAD